MSQYKIMLPVMVAAILMITWEGVSQYHLVNATLFPPPSAVIASFAALLYSGELLTHILASSWRAMAGLIIGSGTGIIIGLLTGRNEYINAAIAPFLHVLRSFPPVAIIPLVIVWFGIGNTAKIFSISFAVFFLVWINAHHGSAQIPEQYLFAASTLTRSVSKKWLAIILPASFPSIITGIRTGIAASLIMVFVSELAGASAGVGYLISVSHLAYRIDVMIVGIFTLGSMGMILDFIFIRSMRGIFPWIEQ